MSSTSLGKTRFFGDIHWKFWALGALLVLMSSYTHPPESPTKVGTMHFPSHTTLEIRNLRRGFKSFQNAEEIQWFICFGHVEDQIGELVGKQDKETNPQVQGHFHHENFSGSSYMISVSDEVNEQLKEAHRKNPMISIWDYIHCEEVRMDLYYNAKSFQYQLKMTEAKECMALDDD